MNFRTGFTVKPKEVLTSGQVIFTDGTNDVTPNQPSCEAYGYTYNVATQTCVAFDYSTRIGVNVSNENNFIKGDRNSTETGTNNTIIVGQNNTTKGDNRNNIIIGDYNEVANGVKNASVFGNYRKAQRDGEFVIGGGGFGMSGVGKAQSSTITLTGTTTDAVATSLFVNGDSNNTIIAREAVTNSFQSFEATVIGVRTGGTAASGSVYDRLSVRVTGLVYLKLVDQSSVDLGKFGTTGGWAAEMAFSGTNDMLFQVTGAANMNISWSCTLNIYNIKV